MIDDSRYRVDTQMTFTNFFVAILMTIERILRVVQMYRLEPVKTDDSVKGL